jgi:hypothetical protein
MRAGRIFAVLTGDIVDSSHLDPISPEPIALLLEGIGKSITGHFRDVIQGAVDVFRGDSWQMVISDPGAAIRIGLLFRTLLRAEYGIDSRVSIGFGEIDYLPQEDISTGTGQAYTLSGQGLDFNHKSARMNLIIPTLQGTQEGQGIKIITQLIDLQVSRWTPGQSQAVSGALLHQTQAEIAASWQPAPVSQQAISQHLENAGWSQVKTALQFLEGVLVELYPLQEEV